MLKTEQVEELICLVSSMSRTQVTEKLLTFRGGFPVDFTEEFLDNLSLERLQHVFVALCLQNNHIPAYLAA